MTRLATGQDGQHLTFCRVCEAICGLVVTVGGGLAVHVGQDKQHIVSQGYFCVKGPGMLPVVYDPDRVLRPLKRRAGLGQFTPVSWDEALGDIVTKLRAITTQHGGDAYATSVGTASSSVSERSV